MAAAQLLAASWIASVSVWRWLPQDLRTHGFIAIDVALAFAFFAMSRGRWFPVPLFFLHAALVAYHVYAGFVGSTIGWVGAFINRAFEMALAYVIACALFRIRRIVRKQKDAPLRARLSTGEDR
ncbi:MAG: hypothetical protein VX640_05020 [Pseudomonadota bacterium]|nr:hypothetical protein [Pseudomonadota bacterium]